MYITATYITYPLKIAAKTEYIADEVVAIVNKIKDNDLRKANVILDTRNKTVLKCRSFIVEGSDSDNPSYEMLLEHFKKSHPQEIEALIKLEEEYTKK